MTQSQQRSTFVTVVAWIFIALSGFATLISILQNIMVYTVFRSPEISQAMQAPPPPGMPPVATFMTSHVHLVFLIFLVVAAFTLVSSIGLLKRWNWARISFIWILALGIAWNIGGLVFQFRMLSSMQAQFAAAPVDGGVDMQPFLVAIAVVGVLLAVAFSVLFGWIAKRLLSPAIVAEFVATPDTVPRDSNT